MAKQAILLQSLTLPRSGFMFTVGCTGVELSPEEAIANKLTTQAQILEYAASHYESHWWIVLPKNKITVSQSGIGSADEEFEIIIPQEGLEEPNTSLDNAAATGLATVGYLYDIYKKTQR